ncbi:hypothetical protein D3C73_1491420 [compost metagenome]
MPAIIASMSGEAETVVVVPAVVGGAATAVPAAVMTPAPVMSSAVAAAVMSDVRCLCM